MQETQFSSWVGKICWRRDRLSISVFLGFPCGSVVKNLPAVWETWVWSLGWEDLLEKGKATHSSILSWKIPRIVHGVAKSQTRLRDFTFFSFYSQCCTFHGSGQLKMTYIQHINIILSIFTALKNSLCSVYLSFFSSHCIHFYFKTYTCQSVGKMWHPSSFRVIHVGWWCLWRYYEINKGQKEDINNVSSSVTAFDGVCLWLEALWGGNTNLKILIKVNAK